jgi:hypothetical protein
MVLITAMPATNVCAQTQASLDEAIVKVRGIKTLSCVINRRQVYNGFCAASLCRFNYDALGGKLSYLYASPFEYSFAIDHEAITAMKRKTGEGYNVRFDADPAFYKRLYASVNICKSFLQLGATNAADFSFRASVDEYVYYEKNDASGKVVIRVRRDNNAFAAIEVFDSAGFGRSFSQFFYDCKKHKEPALPCRIVTTEDKNGTVSTDTLLLSNIALNLPLRPTAFTLPPYRLICPPR